MAEVDLWMSGEFAANAIQHRPHFHQQYIFWYETMQRLYTVQFGLHT